MWQSLPTSALRGKLLRRTTIHRHLCQQDVWDTSIEEHRRDICHWKEIEERKGQCIQNYACQFGKANKGDWIDSSWQTCWCVYWLLSSLWSGTTQEKFPRGCSSDWVGCKIVPWLEVGKFKKEVLTPKRFCFLHAATANIGGATTKEWHQHYGKIYFHFTMQGNDCWRCQNSKWHLHSADAQSLALPSPKGILRDSSCQMKWLQDPLCSSTVVSAKILAIICNDKLLDAHFPIIFNGYFSFVHNYLSYTCILHFHIKYQDL